MSAYKADLLPDAKTCYRYIQAGLGMIVVIFIAGVLVLAMPEMQHVYDVLVMPSLFIGLGLLLFGVGTHLHIMHLNVLEMRGNMEVKENSKYKTD